jgi:hypothetical protein
MTARELIDELRTRGVIKADARAVGVAETDRPWFIALLQGVAGWFAGVFLLVFVGILIEPDSTASIVICGIILLGCAWGLYFADRNAVFLDQLALALSIAGQIALAWAIVKDTRNAALVSAMLLVMQCAVFVVMPNRIARTLAALFASIAWVYLIRFWLRPGGSGDLFFGDDGLYRAPLLGGASVPVGWMLTWLPMVLAAGWLVRREALWMAHGTARFARPALTGMLLGLSFGGVVTEPLSLFALGVERVGIPFSLWSLFPLLSIALALYAAHTAFRVQSHGLVGMAIFAALVHLSRFYYLYGTTLLWKSGLMLLIGAALLLTAIAMRRRGEVA